MSVYIAWEQSVGFKRAWLKQREGEKDWAQTGRYLHVARTATLGGRPSGNAADFPISNDRLDRQILDAIAGQYAQPLVVTSPTPPILHINT